VRPLIVSSEVVPFAKTGGLADVCGALPTELANLGHAPVVIMPAFRQVFEAELPIEETGHELLIPIGAKQVPGSLLQGRLPESDVPVYFVRQDHYYDRPQLYREAGEDYRDNCERFVFFCRAVLEAIRLLELQVDLIHVNDWPTGLVPAYLKAEYADQPGYEGIASLITVHNLAYQGVFWHWDMVLTGLDWKYFNWRQMEFYGNLNFLKTGLAFADAINTVSPRYAEEIQTPQLGCGLEGMLFHRRDSLHGILNGIDVQVWNPATDPHLPANYDLNSFARGKAECKAALQEELQLPQRAEVPVVGLVGRLADQKGWDLILPLMQQWLRQEEVQWAILGDGEPKYREAIETLAQRHPHKVGARLMYSNRLARRIEGGADMFLMPSQYEPCGLNQMYSLRYGTVPVVRATGGLADTISDAHETALADGTANGFSFREYSTLALSETLHRALDCYHNRPNIWKQLIETGMRQDWSWARSAQRYAELYQETVDSVREAVCT